MLNPIPSLLSPFQSSFFIPLLLRIVVALYFIYMAQFLIRYCDRFQNTSFVLIGMPKKWMVYLSAIVTLMVAFLLFIGLRTQWAAIAACVIALKHAVFLRKYESLKPLSVATYILLVVIAATLLISGAGAYAFDLPL